MLLIMLAANCGSESRNDYAAFQARIDAGVACEELFSLRNATDPKSPLIDRMNRGLREIGCYSSSSVRSDQEAQATGGMSSPPAADGAGFTVQQYRIYRGVIATPMGIPEDQAMEAVSRKNGVSVGEVREAVNLVQGTLYSNKWFGTPESEIRRASDWNGETQ